MLPYELREQSRPPGHNRWDGTKWVPVNVVHRGQTATLGGKKVVADGAGNWRALEGRGPIDSRPVLGTYEKDVDRGDSTSTSQVKAPEIKQPTIASLPPSAAQPGTGPENNQVGSDADPSSPGLQGPGGVRVSPSGVVQEGMTLGFRPPTRDQVVDFMGGDYKNPFASNDFAGDAPVGDMFDKDPAEAAAISSGGEVAVDIEGGEITNTTINNAPQNSILTDRASRAFLDAETSMGGKKAQEAELGLVYASGKYWARNPDAGVDGAPELLEIDGTSPGGENRGAIRDYKSGNLSADDFFNTYVKKTQDEIREGDIDEDELETVVV